MNKAAVDTNVLVRLATGDNAEIAHELMGIILDMPAKSILLDNAVIAELIYVLLSVKNYSFSRKDVLRTVSELLTVKQFVCDRPTVLSALELFANTKLDFVDCLLVSLYKHDHVEQLISLDKEVLVSIRQK